MKKTRRSCAVLLLLLLLAGCGNRAGELRLRGIELLEKGKYEEAITTLDQALREGNGKISEEQFDILKYRAEAEYMTGDYDAAQHTLDILTEVDGDREVYRQLRTQIEAKLLIRQAAALLNENRIEEARSLMDQAKEAGLENDRDLRFNEAVYLEKTARWQQAYEAFTEYLQSYAGDKEAERELAFLKTRVEALRQNPALAAVELPEHAEKETEGEG